MFKNVKKVINFILFCIVTIIRLIINQIVYFIICHKEEKLYLKNVKAYERYINLKRKKHATTVALFNHIKEVNNEPITYVIN